MRHMLEEKVNSSVSHEPSKALSRLEMVTAVRALHTWGYNAKEDWDNVCGALVTLVGNRPPVLWQRCLCSQSCENAVCEMLQSHGLKNGEKVLWYLMVTFQS